MTIKRTQSKVVVVFTLEERQRLVKVVALFATVACRTGSTKKKTRKSQQRKKENVVRRIRGPCFFSGMSYHELIDFALARNDYHDRYHSTFVNQRHVPDN